MLLTRTPRTVLVTALAAVSLLAACGGDTEQADRTTTTNATTSAPSTTTTTSSAPAGAACSASELDADLVEQPALPEAVARTRQRIADAAVACDYESLGSLAEEGDEPFTHSFGDAGDPASFWERQEAERDRGRRPLHDLVAILDLPHGVTEHHGVVRYVWPSAFAYGSWDEVPEADREALRPLYGDDDLESFDRFGGYIGHRVVIREDGTWTAFVAGD